MGVLKKYLSPLGIPVRLILEISYENVFHQAQLLPAAPYLLGDASPPAVDPVGEARQSKIVGREKFWRFNLGDT